LNIFLGHPTYGLSVVLFSLLLSSGLGSYTTQKVSVRQGVTRLVGLLIVLFVVGLSTPLLIHALEATPLPVHILVSVLLLFPMGLFLGMAFPIGMKAAQERASELAPWFWGINGATSVCASVLAVIVAINFGVTVTFWTGTAFYVIALLAYLRRVQASGAAA
jgi:predicted membrane-bound spermidine synthase